MLSLNFYKIPDYFDHQVLWVKVFYIHLNYEPSVVTLNLPKQVQKTTN